MPSSSWMIWIANAGSAQITSESDPHGSSGFDPSARDSPRIVAKPEVGILADYFWWGGDRNPSWPAFNAAYLNARIEQVEPAGPLFLCPISMPTRKSHTELPPAGAGT
jgi:hypothetical protein